MENPIRKEDPQRWERYCTRTPLRSHARSEFEDSTDEGSGDPEKEAREDEHGSPMISGVFERLISVDTTEVFSPPRITVQAKRLGLKAGEACDLSTGWASRISSHREAANQHVSDEQTRVAIGSLPCTPCRQLQTLNPDTPQKRKNLREGQEQMRFMISMSKKQMEEKRRFLHEHPVHAKSWHMKEVGNLMRDQGVAVVEAGPGM